MISASDAACLTSHSIASASDDNSIRCSTSDIKSTVCLPHSLVAASHSFERFFLRYRGTVDRPSYTFIWSSFFRKMHQSSAIRLDHLYIVAHATAKDHFNVSANDHFNVSINGHFERSFHAVKTDQISYHFLPFIVDFSTFQFFFSPSSSAIKAQ